MKPTPEQVQKFILPEPYMAEFDTPPGFVIALLTKH